MRVIGLVGWSGAGKTTLLTGVLPLLVRQGVRVSTVKHAHHAFDIDTPGKDSWRHREAGAMEVLVTSSQRFAIMRELHGAPELSLDDLIGRLSPVDLVIAEGFKHERYRKIEVHRVANAKPWLYPHDPEIVGIVSDFAPPSSPPRCDLDDLAGVADMIMSLAQPRERLE